MKKQTALFERCFFVFSAKIRPGYKEKDVTKYAYAIMYNWGGKKYLEREKRYLTEGEMKEINGQPIDEKNVD